MDDQRVHDIDSLLKDVDHLFAVIDAEAQTLREPGTLPSPLGRLTNPGQDALDSLVEPPRDGWAGLDISADGMEVRANFFPPIGSGHPLAVDEFWIQLEKAGVRFGVDHTLIKETIWNVAMDRQPLEALVVARGLPAKDALSERWEILPALTARRLVLDTEAPALDFKNQSPFVLVTPGELLATRLAEEPGVSGCDVFGKTLDFVKKTPRSHKPGENVVESPEGFRAACEGSFRFDNGSFWVDRVLVLESGVGYATGHIDFPGDVHIVGEIASGFRIRAKGSLYSSRVIDATEIVCGGDVITPLGIIGREGSVVRAEGRIQAKFLENVFVVSQGPMDIPTSVLNCVLQTSDKLVMGGRGLVVGGRIQAQNGMELYQVGSARGGKAELICGIDFTVLDKITWIRDQSLSLVKQLKVLETNKKFHPDKAVLMNKACSQIREKVLTLSETARDLASKLDRNEDATVVVRGIAYPGTYIEICHVSHVVSRPVGRVRFSLDKHKNQIRMDPL